MFELKINFKRKLFLFMLMYVLKDYGDKYLWFIYIFCVRYIFLFLYDWFYFKNFFLLLSDYILI